MQNKWPILKGNLALQLCFVALLLFTVLLPFQPFFPPITSGLVAYWLVYILAFQRTNLSRISKNIYTAFWIFYYLILLLGFFYTSLPGEAEKDIILKISLVLWPLGFASWPEPIIKNKTNLLAVFAWTTAASSAAIAVVSFSRWIESGTDATQFFLFTNVWESIPNHYIALYASFSIFIFIDLYLKKQLAFKWMLLGSFVLVGLIALMGVRIQFLALPAAGLVFMFMQSVAKELKKKLFIYASFSFLAIATVAAIVPSSRNRMLETVDEIRSFNGMVNDKQTNHRVFLWQYGAKVIQDNFWIGTGTGAADLALNEKLLDCEAEFWNGHRLYRLHEKSFNYHNAFLQHFATHGILGFILFVALFVLPFIVSRNQIGGLEAAFLVLCFIAFSTESMLQRQAGVLFFGFFYSLLFVANKSIKGK